MDRNRISTGMRTRIYRLYAAAVADTSNAANVQIQRAGTIVGIFWAHTMLSTTDGTSLVWELSFSSTQQTGTNDATGVVSTVANGFNITTSGATAQSAHSVHAPLAIPVSQGDRLYLHFELVGGTPASGTRAYCHVAVAE